MWREDWINAEARVDLGLQFKIFAFMGALFLLLTLPIVFKIPSELRRGDPVILAVLLFPIGAAFLLRQALLARRRERRFGCSRVLLGQVPICPGTTWNGSLVISPGTLAPHEGKELTLELKLSCLHKRVSGGGKSRSTFTSVLWQEIRTMNIEAAATADAVPFSFEIPAAAQSTDESNRSDRIVWVLESRVTSAKTDFGLEFDIPVFAASGASAQLAGQRKPFQSDPTPELNSRIASINTAGIRSFSVSEAPDGAKVAIFGPLLAPGPSLALMAFGFLFLGSAAFLGLAIFNFPITGSILGSPFILVFGAIGLLLLGLGAMMLLRKRVLVIRADSVEIRNQIFFVRWASTFSAGELASVELQPSMQQGTRVWYDIKLVAPAQRQHGLPRKYTVAHLVSDKLEAEWLASELRKSLFPRNPTDHRLSA